MFKYATRDSVIAFLFITMGAGLSASVGVSASVLNEKDVCELIDNKTKSTASSDGTLPVKVKEISDVATAEHAPTAAKPVSSALTADNLRETENIPETLEDPISAPAPSSQVTASIVDGTNRLDLDVLKPPVFNTVFEDLESSPRTMASSIDHMRAVTIMRRVSIESWSNFMVGIDGSAPSKMAMEVCLQELMTNKDGLIALHCFDSLKQNSGLDSRFKPEALKREVEEQLLTRTSKECQALNWVDKRGESTSNCVVRTVNDMTLERESFVTSLNLQKSMGAPSYFVTGVAGRKQSGMGSLPLLAAAKLHLPNIIVKKPPIIDRGRKFVVCIKDADQEDLYDIARDLMKPGKGDTLVVVHLYEEKSFNIGSSFVDNGPSELIEYLSEHFEELFAVDGVQGKFLPLMHKGTAFKSETLLKAFSEEKADYVIIQPSLKVYGAEISRCTMDIIGKSDCNIVCCNH